MNVLSRDECERWITAHVPWAPSLSDSGGLRLETPSLNEQTMGSVVPLARLLTNAAMTGGTHAAATGRCLLIVFETGIWESSEHRPLYRAWRERFAPMSERIEEEGHLFEASEFDECQSLACIALFFGWGFRLIGDSAGAMVECDHDGRLRIATREPQALAPMASSLTSWFS